MHNIVLVCTYVFKLHVIEGGRGDNRLPVYVVAKQVVEFPQVLVSLRNYTVVNGSEEQDA